MKIDSTSIDFFLSIPDEVLAKIAFYDRESLERLCMALSLDIQLLKESTNNEGSNNRGNVH
jgi:hypothetical protein